MMAVRLVSYVVDPYTDERVPVAALLSEGGRVQVIRAPDPRVPEVAKANLERILRDIEEAPRMDALPVGAGAHAVVGALLPLNLALADAPAWVRDVLLGRAA
jgi:hypothetical protein